MSGHSKWASIKHKKGALDAKRGKLFTKLIREITVAAREGGGDVDANPRLRLAVQKAKDSNMPSDNIERGIKKGTGELAGVSYEPVSFEGYAVGGVAVIVEGLTDNKNRTAQEVRHAFSKYNGNMAEAGAVSWIFERKGVMSVETTEISDSDEFMLQILDAGAEDIDEGTETVSVITKAEDLMSVVDKLKENGFDPKDIEITYIPKTTIAVTGKDAERVLQLVTKLEELDDIQNVYANFDIDDVELEQIMEELG